MAGIDWTTIAFKNGELYEEYPITVGGFKIYLDRSGGFLSAKSHGKVVSHTDMTIAKSAEVYYTPRDLYRLCGFPKFQRVLQGIFPKKKHQVTTVKSFSDEYITILEVAMKTGETAVFIKVGIETLCTVGGYGHYGNPYIHFYRRGYGKYFENKMAKECYHWMMENVVEEYAEAVNDNVRDGNWIDGDDIRSAFFYKSYWNMTEEEREKEYGD